MSTINLTGTRAILYGRGYRLAARTVGAWPGDNLDVVEWTDADGTPSFRIDSYGFSQLTVEGQSFADWCDMKETK